ncbi:MAG: methyltransferase [SAR86 cluster bacterium]|uniref:Methyltransferase n=1 Tax=SAR86 cluster bacterium TaxID=2030880 RepID=A0A2A5AW03_9GAMM|nr:MAG: methyltransferase [SAR86 cluster bacterium]
MLDPMLTEIITQFFSAEDLQPRRIFHGRGQLFPGLAHICIDWFEPIVLITAYSEIEEPEDLLNAILNADQYKKIESVVLQKRYEKGAPVELLKGDSLLETVVNENGLLFEVHPGAQQNAGLFLDMWPLREWLQANCEGKNVLNLFAYTCSLSVAAMAGGASGITNVDMSKPSIKWGEKNHQLNSQNLREVRSIPHNLFKSWGRIKQSGRYNLVIIDPPTRQRGSFDVAVNYPAVLKKLRSLCAPDADIIATINSPFLDIDFLPEKFERHVPNGSYLGQIDAAPEFADKFPERGLKIYHFKMPPAESEDS